MCNNIIITANKKFCIKLTYCAILEYIYLYTDIYYIIVSVKALYSISDF